MNNLIKLLKKFKYYSLAIGLVLVTGGVFVISTLFNKTEDTNLSEIIKPKVIQPIINGRFDSIKQSL